MGSGFRAYSAQSGVHLRSVRSRLHIVLAKNEIQLSSSSNSSERESRHLRARVHQLYIGVSAPII